ncbi:TetR/AcrR family transcriptional regulator [Treponema sp.]|uniref:TetR/AcrR family transcriptional regulator n=1 Tax=Treponema sp. TaxID=166 RepID=UPI003F00550E
MAIVVEHEKRKREILEKSFQLFIEDGYEDVTYQKIADKCGITRTTLYIYFKNKREIFLWSIKQLTNDVEQEIVDIIRDEQIDSVECLKRIFLRIIAVAEKNREFFQVLKMYLVQLEKSGVDINDRVTRRVIRIQHLMTTVLIRGQKRGDIKKLPLKEMNNLLYCLLETSIFRLGILSQKNLDEMRGTVQFVIEQFRAEQGEK